MRQFSFEVPGRPVPKARARSGRGHHYTPARTRAYERAVKLSAASAVPAGWQVGGRYEVTIIARFADRRRRDLDNVAKSVLDALNGVAWLDDSSVDRIDVKRVFDDVPEGVSVWVWLTDENPPRARARKHVSKTLSIAAAAK